MATKIQKGTKVYLFTDWNRRGWCLVEEFAVESIGAKRAHLRSVDGQMRKHELYAGAYDRMVAVADCADPRAEGLKRGAAFRLVEIRHVEECIANAMSPEYPYADSIGTIRYLENMTKQLDLTTASTPTVGSMDELVAAGKGK